MGQGLVLKDSKFLCHGHAQKVRGITVWCF